MHHSFVNFKIIPTLLKSWVKFLELFFSVYVCCKLKISLHVDWVAWSVCSSSLLLQWHEKFIERNELNVHCLGVFELDTDTRPVIPEGCWFLAALANRNIPFVTRNEYISTYYYYRKIIPYLLLLTISPSITIPVLFPCSLLKCISLYIFFSWISSANIPFCIQSKAPYVEFLSLCLRGKAVKNIILS